MAVELNDGARVVKLEIYIQSITIREFRDLRLAAAEAESNGAVTWLMDAAGNVTSAIVPAEFAARALQIVPLT
jgi:hypothetical protein